jgi:hypothetical protein
MVLLERLGKLKKSTSSGHTTSLNLLNAAFCPQSVFEFSMVLTENIFHLPKLRFITLLFGTVLFNIIKFGF